MTFNISVYEAEHEELSNREKERLAVSIHRLLQEDFDVHPDSVGVEGHEVVSE